MAGLWVSAELRRAPSGVLSHQSEAVEKRRNAHDNGQGGEGCHEDSSLRDALPCPLAVRAASFARCVVSKPGQALPPPTGIAAWSSGSLRTGAGGVFYTKPFGGVSPTCRTLA